MRSSAGREHCGRSAMRDQRFTSVVMCSLQANADCVRVISSRTVRQLGEPMLERMVRAHTYWTARGVVADLDAFQVHVVERTARVEPALRDRMHLDDLFLA